MPTANAFPSSPVIPLPQALTADASAGTIVFTDRAGVFRYDGPSGTLGVLSTSPGVPIDRTVIGVRFSPFGNEVAPFDTRAARYLRLLPQETALYGSLSVSGDAVRVAYLTTDKHLRIAFQQIFGNVDGRALAGDRLFTSALIAPSGRTIALIGSSRADRGLASPGVFLRGDGVGQDAWLVDVETGAAKQIYCSLEPCPAGLTRGGENLQLLSWSPDERYLAVRVPSVASGVDFDGTDASVLDISTGTLTKLGLAQSFPSWRTWIAPHTLVLTMGLGRDATKALRLWSPEGLKELTPADGFAISPSAATATATGTVYFVQKVGDVPHVAALDVRSGAIRRLAADPAYADDAVRVSIDGRDLLVLRRRLADGQLELWRMPVDESAARALVRFAPPPSAADLSRYGTQPTSYWLDQLAWSR